MTWSKTMFILIIFSIPYPFVKRMTFLKRKLAAFYMLHYFDPRRERKQISSHLHIVESDK